jgi:hypothetical protein
MTLEDAIQTQPAWLSIWLNVMMLGAFVAPLALLIWRESRVIGALAIVAGVLSAIGVSTLYDMGGYTKLLGLPHILLYTPLAYVIWRKIKSGDLRAWPKRIAWVVLITILVSLAFDYTDFVRYLLGNRTPLPGTL